MPSANLFLLPCLLSAACPDGEYALDPPNCTTCWPCEPGFQCTNGSKRGCEDGMWSGRGESWCRGCDAMCREGFLRVRACDSTGDLVCAACPPGFGCDGGGEARVCLAGTYSLDGMCVDCGSNYSSDAGAWECVCLGGDGPCTGCPPGYIAVGTQCRPSPKGYGLVFGELQLCPGDTYSSATGHCLPCSQNAWSEPGASSEDECVCVDGYTRSGKECVPCKSGTVFENNRCVLCPPGEYCLGKTHHEPCPTDMYSHRGVGMCTPCRMNSGCLRNCVTAANCTCDDGYIDVMGECRRCPSGTIESYMEEECEPCPPGYECKGGADVLPCSLTTWSPGNVSSCHVCENCPEITASRCNSTHDSVCESTLVPLGVLNVFQQYTIVSNAVDGEMFATFALLYVASIPKAQLLRVCDKDQCVQCFQGLCPEASKMRRLFGPGYEIAFEVRTFASRIEDNLDALNRPAYLSELAKTTMHKLTDDDFHFFSRIEHSTICPAGLVWDKVVCRERRTEQRSWLGLLLSMLIIVSLAVLGWNGRKWAGDLRDCCYGKKKGGGDVGNEEWTDEHLVDSGDEAIDEGTDKLKGIW